MVKVKINYEGGLRCELEHELSGKTFQTDAPVDNNGKGESFSPTDLCASALGSCIATIVGMQMESLGLDLSGMRIEVQKEMSESLPRRIAKLTTDVWLPIELDDDQQWKVQLAAKNCPVHHSLNPEIEKPINFHWK
ncbi:MULTISPECIES: OsmC family protein [unclassified Lentimonas]|uniref:OsmC family protein n=1 Tax=unclassified Lentimonas TaxID=2630993 RepID=UPI00132462DB|nr:MULTISPECIES: OsmC family protein [unclassified Lentimonas]CAA6676393.1 putative stress-induced protein OsmC [Lentimonas sp. CC4]CAA6685232.1 putative stress-induced protein OsmC [Lentimonas sp. CC6]CAA6693421.1 putative stress-induced protein OsmC [Lentimonas sp. CC19]CAA6696469.1 putative stress-induced protein OsmC [Lentimonas sp. CC10]CAA7072372.1 putative stress-induced protein OsmC [Lentimonas sp. CC11]